MKKIGVPVQPSTTPNQQQQSVIDHHRRSPSMKRLTTPVLAFAPFSHTVNPTKPPANASTSNEDDHYLNATTTTTVVAVNSGERSHRQSSHVRPINYKNGRKIEPMFFSYSTYYRHKENLPQHYNSLVQYLENTEVKYHNDNLYDSSSIGLPTRAQ